jgi:hypothetical protein
MHRTALALCLPALLAGAALAAGQEPPEPERRPDFAVRRATSDIDVDGYLTEDAWLDAAAVPIVWEWQPGDNVRPPVRTEALVTYDDRHLYIAFRAQDPEPQKIRAHLMDRDTIDTFVQDDHVGVMIDPFNDERRAFQLRVNPLGVQADASFSEMGGGEDWSWDMIWSSAARIGPEGYTVEIAVPFHQIRFPRTSGPQTWGFEAFRSWPRSVRHRMSSRYTERGASCVLCQQNRIVGLEGLKPGLNLEIAPTLTYAPAAHLDAFPNGKLSWRDESPDLDVLGISARWAPSSNIALNAAVNPDFSQVEADVAQLAVNNRFALFFPEKRPFFLEGADFFSTPINAVFTRTVADPSWGAKATGKMGSNAGGFFVARDDLNNLLIPSNQASGFASLDSAVTSSVGRYRRDIGRASTVGLLYAGREGEDYHNRVYGADAFLRLGASNTIRAQILRSDTQYPDVLALELGQGTDAFDGTALRVSYNHNSRGWGVWANYEDRSRGFRADAGFVPRVDLRIAETEIVKLFWADQSWFTRIGTGVYLQRTTDQGGDLTDQAILATGSYNGPMQSSMWFQAGQLKEHFDGVTYTQWRQVSEWSMQPSSTMRLSFFERYGDTVDYANSRAATVLLLQPGLELKLGQHVNVQLNHALQRLNVDGGRLFTANLSQARLVYQFNTRMFARAILQYADISRNVELYSREVDPHQRTLFSQLLFSYKLNPQTVVFLGYSDDRLGLEGVDLTQTTQSVFMKIGYAWVL